MHMWGFPGGSGVKNPPAKQETWIQSLSQEDPLEKEMVIHSSLLAWETPWTEEPAGSSPRGRKQSDMTERLNHHHYPTDVSTLSSYSDYLTFSFHLVFLS